MQTPPPPPPPMQAIKAMQSIPSSGPQKFQTVPYNPATQMNEKKEPTSMSTSIFPDLNNNIPFSYPQQQQVQIQAQLQGLIQHNMLPVSRTVVVNQDFSAQQAAFQVPMLSPIAKLQSTKTVQ
jgi:hypothetical protein